MANLILAVICMILVSAMAMLVGLAFDTAGIVAVGWTIGTVGTLTSLVAAFHALRTALRAIRSEESDHLDDETRVQDPVRLAEAYDPESAGAARLASERIALLRSVSADSTDADVVEALVLADRHSPGVMRHCLRAVEACATDEERRDTVRKAILAHVAIGEQADAARRRVLAARADALDTDLRYVASRTSTERALTPIA